jgi:hypothetical protein
MAGFINPSVERMLRSDIHSPLPRVGRRHSIGFEVMLRAPIEASWQKAKRSEQDGLSHVPVLVCTYNGDSSLYVLSQLPSTWYVLCCNASITTKYNGPPYSTSLQYSYTHTVTLIYVRVGKVYISTVLGPNDKSADSQHTLLTLLQYNICAKHDP